MSFYNKKISIESFAVISMGLYVTLISAAYISPFLERLQSIFLYAFLALSILVVMIRGKIEINPYFVWYFGFAILSFLSVLYSPDSSASLKSFYTMVVSLGLTFAMIVVLNSQKRIECFFKCLIFGTIVLFAYLLFTGQLTVDTNLRDFPLLR